jgi:peptide/nickel transport system substrate-binding protein
LKRFSRRSAISTGAIGVAAVVAACSAPAPTPAPTQPPAKPAEAAKPAAAEPTKPAAAPAGATKPTEAAKPAAPSAATTAPAAAASAPAAAASAATKPAEAAKPAAPAGAAPSGRILILQTVDAESLDPNVLRSAVGLNIGQQVQEGLTDRALKPLLARSWKNLDDRTWEFELQPGVKFHNGEPFDAAAVKYSVERVLDESNKAPGRGILTPVIDKVEALSPTSVRISTKTPFALLLDVMLDVWMVPPQGSKQPDFATKGWGTGPYRVKEWVRNERVVLEANPDYWGPKARIGEVVFRPVGEASTRVVELRSGNADLITIVPSTAVPDLDSANLGKLQRRSIQTMRIVFKADAPPFNDVKVRQAANYAVDKEGILRGILRGAGYVMNGAVAADMFGHNEALKPYEYDPEKAKALLKESGATNLEVGFQMPSGRFLGDKAIGEAVVDQLNKVGFKATGNFMDFGTWIQQFNKGGNGYMVLGQDAYPHRLFTSLSSKLKPVTWYGYSNSQVDGLIDQAVQTFDEGKRRDIYRQLHQITRDEAAWLYLFNTQDIYGFKPTVKGFNPSADGYFYVKDISLG